MEASALEGYVVSDGSGGEELIDAIWRVGPEEATSEEDEPGIHKPRLGEGRLGEGSPIYLNDGAGQRPFHDGAGLCSPGRWLPEKRARDAIAQKLHDELMNVLSATGDLVRLACRLATGSVKECPFSEELLEQGRSIIRSILKVDKDKYCYAAEPGQPFLLALAAHMARVLGDPDWRMLVDGKVNYKDGVPVGFRERLPRTPAVYERKV